MTEVMVEKVLLHNSSLAGHTGKIRTLVITCPYCGKKHNHGGGTESEDIQESAGHRGSHCGTAKNEGYVLVIPDDIKSELVK